MMDDKALREKLAKVEALFRRAASPGEKAAAGAAMDRLHDRLGSWDRNPDPEENPDLGIFLLELSRVPRRGVVPAVYSE